MLQDIEISPPLAEAMAAKGYDTLTPVQAAMLDPGLASQDLLVSAQTGSGKTVAFGLALAPSLLEGAPRLDEAPAPLALIIAPTRELALQVTEELRWLYAPAGGQIASCIGGMDMRDERRALARGVHIVVGTPGRLVDHIQRGSLDMSALRAIVLDEADEMLNMGFREELEEILTAAPEHRRTLMFSATVSKPIARLAENYQKDAVRLNTLEARQQHVDIAYQALTVLPDDVENAVINLLLYHDAPNALVFCARREGVNKLTSRLNNRGFSVVALSGEFSQKERSNALTAMRDGRARVCVATDVAARGIDLPGLDLVIHADLPRDTEALLHRSGRTGRAGRKGVCALVVPMRARRRTERLLQDAGIVAEWTTPPTAGDIDAVLRERFLAHPALNETIAPHEREAVAQLLERFAPEQLAAACLRLTEAGRSAPEEIQPVAAERPRRERGETARDSEERGPRRERTERPRGQARADFEDGSWVRLGVGRRNNADPKWLVPMLCKSGGFQRDQIGVIQIGPMATHVELRPEAADQLMAKAGPRRIIDKSINVDRSGPPDAEAPSHAPEPRERARKPRAERSPDAPAFKPKHRPKGDPSDAPWARERPKKKEAGEAAFADKSRKGPKKPRGPNGEKKRSPGKGKPARGE